MQYDPIHQADNVIDICKGEKIPHGRACILQVNMRSYACRGSRDKGGIKFVAYKFHYYGQKMIGINNYELVGLNM